MATEDRSDFYVTLSSNASVEYYPENRLNHFSNRLAEPLVFSKPDEWEVGLTEMFTPPNRWHELGVEDLSVDLLTWVNIPGVGDDVTRSEVTAKIQLHPFKLGRDFVKNMTSALKRVQAPLKEGIQLSTLGALNHVSLRLRRNVFVKFSQRLQAVLGLEPQSLTPSGALGSVAEKQTYNFTVDVNAGYHSMWVYSNCCQHRMVGGVRVPLLRTILTSGVIGGVTHSLFTSPYYFRVSSGHLPSVEVFITDNTGNPVPFSPGEVVSTLHFRRRVVGGN